MGELLVAHERLDDGVLDPVEGRATGVGHLDARAPQRRQQVRARVGVEVRGAEDPAHLGRQLLQQPRPGTARRPRPEQVGEQPVVDVDPPRHAGVGHLRGDERARGLGGEQEPEAYGLGRGRDRGDLAGVLEVGTQVLGRVVGAEERGVGRLGRSQPVPQVRLLAVEQAGRRRPGRAAAARWHSRRSWQRSTRTPAASSGGYQRAVSSQTQRGASSASRAAATYAGSAVTSSTSRRSPSTTSHALTGQPGEVDARHGDTFPTPPTSAGRRRGFDLRASDVVQ